MLLAGRRYSQTVCSQNPGAARNILQTASGSDATRADLDARDVRQSASRTPITPPGRQWQAAWDLESWDDGR